MKSSGLGPKNWDSFGAGAFERQSLCCFMELDPVEASIIPPTVRVKHKSLKLAPDLVHASYVHSLFRPYQLQMELKTFKSRVNYPFIRPFLAALTPFIVGRAHRVMSQNRHF